MKPSRLIKAFLCVSFLVCGVSAAIPVWIASASEKGCPRAQSLPCQKCWTMDKCIGWCNHLDFWAAGSPMKAASEGTNCNCQGVIDCSKLSLYCKNFDNVFCPRMKDYPDESAIEWSIFSWQSGKTEKANCIDGCRYDNCCCTGDSGCDSGNCSGGSCAHCPGAGWPCSSSGNCCPGLRCSQSICVLECSGRGEHCTSNVDCCAGLGCFDGHCT